MNISECKSTHNQMIDSRTRPGWMVVGEQELRDLWLGGGAWVFILGISLLLSILTYLFATNEDLHLLTKNEMVFMTLQVTLTISLLMSLLVSTNAFSGERDNKTIESLLLTPVPRHDMVIGKVLAALSLYFATLVLMVPYVWVTSPHLGSLIDALSLALIPGFPMVLFFVFFGILVSIYAGTNRISLTVSLFAFMAFLSPNQLPGGVKKGWLGDLIFHLNPVTSGFQFIEKALVDSRSWSDITSWLVSPVLAAIVFIVVGLFISDRYLTLEGGMSR